MLRNRALLMGIILFGSIWGLSEVLIDKLISPVESLPRGAVLSVVAILILATGRVVLERPGSSVVLGLIAGVFKLLNLPFFPCKVFAVLLLAGTFEVVYHLMGRIKGHLRGFIGSVTLWVCFTAFALIMTYLVKYRWWAEGGLPKVLHYILVDGSYAAIGGFLTFNLGERLGRSIKPYLYLWEQKRAGLYFVSLLALLACLVSLVL